MTSIEDLIPAPRLVELSSVELDAPPSEVWDFVRHGDLGDSPLVRALFALRTLPSRLVGSPRDEPQLRIDGFRSTREQPGFALLAEDPPHALTVGAIGKVWQLDIPFFYVEGAESFAQFSEPDWVKVAWEVRIDPWGESGSRLSFEVRVDATDEPAWNHFRNYWRIVGPGSHFIRRALLSRMRRRFGSPDAHEEERPLPGDELLGDASAQITQTIQLEARPEQIWPWLLQMGCDRAGFYSVDAIDNGGMESAREIHAEWQDLTIGQIISASPGQDGGFEVLALEPQRSLVLGGLFDAEAKQQLPFATSRPEKYWHVTWAFFLEPLDESTTRLHVRARAQFSPSEWLHLAWIRPVHSFMQHAQLHNLATRIEGQLRRDTPKDIGEGVLGATIMALSFLTPFLRARRNHFGMSIEEANRVHVGDELVEDPDWSWTHAIEIDAAPAAVWPWVTQLGADRAGFYSYQWLENLVGCDLHNAESVHPDWALKPGDRFFLHPKVPPFPVVRVEPERTLLVFAAADEKARASGQPWATASWAFLIEPRAEGKSRLISRFRTACSADLQTRFAQGPALLEPIGFAMDRRMLMGIKERAERAETRSGPPVRERDASHL